VSRRVRFASARGAEAYLLGFVNYELVTRYRQTTRTHDLALFRKRLTEAGWKPGAVASVHVGGTNAKGTVCWLLERILRAGGLRTGLYVSPHLHAMRERIRIGGRSLGARAFADGVARIASRFPEKPGAGFRTTFEHLTALAFLTFQEADVDVAVVEVGLGGRLDATNVLPPGAAVLTPISLDHADVLGRSVAEIARDKARILKRGGRAFVMPQSRTAWAGIEERLRNLRAGAVRTSEACPTRVVEAGPAGSVLHVLGQADYGLVSTGLLGEHQADNVSAAVSVAETLLPRETLREAVRRGLREVSVPGRLDLLELEGKRVIVDGGHNPAAAGGAARAMTRHFPGTRAVAVVGMARDKDHRSFLEALGPCVREFIFTRAESPRAVDPGVLRSKAARGSVAPSVSVALERALDRADLVLVSGSFLVAGEARAFLGRRSV